MKNNLKVLEKGRIGNLEVKNRMLMSSMVTNYCNEDGTPTERFTAYHERRARGGIGLVTVEASYVTLAGRGFPNQAGLHQDRNIRHGRISQREYIMPAAKCQFSFITAADRQMQKRPAVSLRRLPQFHAR